MEQKTSDGAQPMLKLRGENTVKHTNTNKTLISVHTYSNGKRQ